MRKYQSTSIVLAAQITTAEFKQDGSGKLYTVNPGQPNDRTLWIVPPGFKLPNTLPRMNYDGGDWFILHNNGRMSWMPKADFEQQFTPAIEDGDSAERGAQTLVVWKETARHYASKADYYRDIVDRIGHLLGDEMRTTDTGEIRQEILRAKVYEVAERRLARPAFDEVALGKEVASKVTALHWGIGQSLPEPVPAAVLVRRQDQVAEVVRSCLAEIRANPPAAPEPTPFLDRVALAKTVAAKVMEAPWAGQPHADRLSDYTIEERTSCIVDAVQQALAATTPLPSPNATPVVGNFGVYIGPPGNIEHKGNYLSLRIARAMAHHYALEQSVPMWRILHTDSGLTICATDSCHVPEEERHPDYKSED